MKIYLFVLTILSVLTPTAGIAQINNNMLDLFNTSSDSARIEWVQNYSSNLLPGNNYAGALAADGIGNIYVTGSSVRSGAGFDIMTIKYSIDGDVIWKVHYDGPWSGNDNAQAMVMDSQNNILVAGTVEILNNLWDIVIIKYDTSGNEIWQTLFDDQSFPAGSIIALKTDANDNIYLTCYCYGVTHGQSSTTLKYNSEGALVWVATYENIIPKAMVIDDSGAVFITGTGWGDGTDEDYVTLKFDSNGNLLWDARFNSRFNFKDRVVDLAVAMNGDVYVTGSIDTLGTFPYQQRISTVKYDSEGNQIWVAEYPTKHNITGLPSAISIDKSGKILISGATRDINLNWKAVLLRYDLSGVRSILASPIRTDSSYLNALSIDIQNDGIIYLAGSNYTLESHDDYRIVKYDVDGTLIWTFDYGSEAGDPELPSDFIVDKSGNSIITGRTIDDNQVFHYLTVKVSPTGQLLWAERYSGEGRSYDRAIDLIADKSGGVVVTGASRVSGYNNDIVTIKYNSQGEEEWLTKYDGEHNLDDSPLEISINSSEEILVFGSSYDSISLLDFLLIKYDLNGNEIWVSKFDAHGNSNDIPKSMTIDISGNIVITGRSYTTDSGYDIATVKFDPSGEILWTANYAGEGTSWDGPSRITHDITGNVYLTGQSNGNFITIKYSPEGEELWTAIYDNPEHSNQATTGIVVDSDGNVYITGKSGFESIFAPSEFSVVTIKYDTNGDELWNYTFDFPNSLVQTPNNIQLDNNNNVIVGINSGSLSCHHGNCKMNFHSALLLKYDSNGNEIWNSVIPLQKLTNFTIDNWDNVIAVGFSNGRFALAKINSNGSPDYETTFKRGIATAVTLASGNNIFVTGYTGESVFTTVKYNNIAVSVDSEFEITDVNYLLTQNYPNPFNPETVIEYALPIRSEVKLIIYNLRGQQVALLINGTVPAGNHRVTWNASNFASGIYFYRLQADDFVQTKKMVLLK